MFFLGGAPGVSATWQEFGGLGPKRMKWTNDGTAGLPPYSWVDNPNTLLGQADLVFVNPVGTAFSRPGPARPAARTFGIRPPTSLRWESSCEVSSIRTIAGIRRSFWRARISARRAPAGLAAYLTEHQIPVHGVVLLSMTMSADAVAGDAQYMTLLPSLTMAAWYHKKLAPELNAMSAEQISGQARQFASREYLHALYKGDRMTPEERTKVIADLSRLTGLSKAFLVNNDLRITAGPL